MKTYQAPKLNEKGSTVALTLGLLVGKTDPDANQAMFALGSAGFNL
jgi:hypothetical protein